ncbi:MAG: carboxypeptidase-like regulatory domain-containing protein [Bacteroidales bacterium]|nr:carboxypeptidase-like regulatory domain-containing protein [Bacteroidales bacterium]
MKRVIFIAIASLILINLSATAKDRVSTEAKTEVFEHANTLKGIVADKATQETLAGATITANGQKVYTDLDGNFNISNLCSGKCQLKISLISYKDQTVEIDTNNVQSLQIKLEQQ